MLNRRKTKKNFIEFNNINDQKTLVPKNKLFQIPGLSKNHFVQTNLSKRVDFGLPLVFVESETQFTKTELNNSRFGYDSKQFKRFYRYFSFKRKSSSRFVSGFRSFFVFLHNISKKRKKIPYRMLKQIKGGFMVSAFGAICFVPRSLYKNVQKQQIINFKLFQKHTKKFTRPSTKINLVSSLKYKKHKG